MSENKFKITDPELMKKLSYINLNLDDVPKGLLKHCKINFSNINDADEKKYKQYRYINTSDIEIILTSANKMDSIKEKYEKSVPLCFYLDSSSEENGVYFSKFMEMLNKIEIAKVEEIEEEQKRLSKSIPFKVKYNKNYLWQIYYQEITGKYFMLVSTEDSDFSTFFYILKKKLENSKNEKIFVPISLADYDEAILRKEEIKEIENYLWLFTKDYPLIYEVTSKSNKTILNIIGETEIYNKIKTTYKIKFVSQKEAMRFYKLLKALFMLQTELPNYFKFETHIEKDGSIKFYYDNKIVQYENIADFINEQYTKSANMINKIDYSMIGLKNKLSILQEEESELEEEYKIKEKQITIYLKCKKSFFGKMKYYLKFGKYTKNESFKEKIDDEESVEENNEVAEIEIPSKKYTLYELEKNYKALQSKEEEIKNVIMDINALKLKNKNLKKKIENASNYLEEINKHKKSIFEFWKYANKDAVMSLEEGEEEEYNIQKVQKVFNYEGDFEKFGSEVDKLERNKYTDDELDSAFISTTHILELIKKFNNKTVQNAEISAELKNLKKEQQEKEENYEEDLPIFGKLIEANKEMTIGSKIHRESPRNKFSILEVTRETRGKEFKDKLENILKNIKSAIIKNNLKEDTYVYKASLEKLDFSNLESVSLDIEKELNEFLESDNIKGKIYLYKLKLKKNTNFIAFSNIIYFDNKNMTLPVGMDLSSKILVDLSNQNFDETNTIELKKLHFDDEKDDFSTIRIKHIEVKEFE